MTQTRFPTSIADRERLHRKVRYHGTETMSAMNELKQGYFKGNISN